MTGFASINCAEWSRSIHYTAKSDRPGTIPPRGHQQKLLVFVEPVGLGKIPDRSSWLIIRTAARNRRTRVLVAKLVGPLGNISSHVEHAEGTGPCGKRIHIGWRAHHSPVVG